MKKHIIYERMDDAPRAYLSNGVVGLRVGRNPLREASALLNGFSGRQELHEIEAYAPLPCPVVDIITSSAGELPARRMLSGPSDRFIFEQQSYDFSCGELTTRFTFHPDDRKDIACEHTIFCSRTSPTLHIARLTLTAQEDTDAELVVRIDAANMPVDCERIIHTNDCDGSMLISGKGKPVCGQAGVSYYTKWTGDGERLFPNTIDYLNASMESHVLAHLQAGKPWRLDIITSCVPSALHHEPHLQAIRMIKLAQWEGFDLLRQKNRDAWAELWKGRILVNSDSELLQDWVDAAYFYLHTSMHTSSPFSIAPLGLGERFLYKGHVFWDTESYMFLLPLMTQPHVAQAMLDYRFDRIDAARRNAKLQGYRGLQFPWQSFATGEEVTRSSASQAGGAGEQHVNMDVALAFALYVRATGDPMFMREKAWPVLHGVSEWIESRVARTSRGYEILHVTGIDEGVDNIDNNAYTNILCARVLREASAMGEKLGYPPNKRWLNIAENLYIPVDQGYGYIQQYENAPMADMLSCETVMTYFPYGFRAGEPLDTDTIRMYVDHGMEDQLRYPMLSGFLGIFPAWLGRREQSRLFFEKANAPFMRDPFLLSVEWVSWAGRDPDNMPTPFLTGRASFLAGVMLGLTRLNLFANDGEEFEGPISLPAGWEEITLSRIYLRGRPARITARHGDAKAAIEWLDD